MAAMVNPALFAPQVKDSRWLTLEVCREFTRQKCTRSETECKFAHPPPHVEVQNGRVTCCFDSIKGKCTRKDPPCKYLHPPQHLREQLLQNGRNNLIMRNLQMTAMAQGLTPTAVLPHQFVNSPLQAATPSTNNTPASAPAMSANQLQTANQLQLLAHPGYMTAVQNPPTAAALNPYQMLQATSMQMPGAAISSLETNGVTAVSSPAPNHSVTVLNANTTGVQPGQKMARPVDRLEVCREYQRGNCSRHPDECRYAHPSDNITVENLDNTCTVCMDFINGKCGRESCRYYHPPAHLQAAIKSAQRGSSTASTTGPVSSPAITGPAGQGVVAGLANGPGIAVAAAAALRVASQLGNPATAANSPATPTLPPVVEVLTGHGKKRPRDPADDFYLSAMPGMVPMVKRPAMPNTVMSDAGKSAFPMIQPTSMTSPAMYQQLAMQMQMQQQPYVPVTTLIPSTQAAVTAAAGALVTNSSSVVYFDENNQLLDTLPVCRDYKSGLCKRPQCKYVHLVEDYVEIADGKVTVCRDAAKGKCSRSMCKYYHIPIIPQIMF